jgi:hypothetical protein
MKRKSHSFREEALVGKKAVLGKKFWLAKKKKFWGRSFGWQKGSFGEEVLVGEEDRRGRSFGWQKGSFGEKWLAKKKKQFGFKGRA